MEVRLLPPAFSFVHDKTYTVVVLYWFRSLAVNQAHVGSIPIDHPFTLEDIRLDEETVLNTAGANTLRGSSPWSSALMKYIVLWPSGEGNCLTNSRSTVRVCPGLLGHWR